MYRFIPRLGGGWFGIEPCDYVNIIRLLHTWEKKPIECEHRHHDSDNKKTIGG